MKIVLSKELKNEMISFLMQQGYSPYARLLRPFDLYLTDDVDFVGGMEPGKARIILNKYLSPKEASLVLRHEILHEFLDHEMRMNDYHTASGKSGSHELANVAMDFDISNQGYTDADKSTVRGLTLETPFEKLKRGGLITEDQFPGWEDLSFEEMYDKLIDMQEDEQNKIKKLIQKTKQNVIDINTIIIDDDDNQGGNPPPPPGGNPPPSGGNPPPSGGNPPQGGNPPPIDSTQPVHAKAGGGGNTDGPQIRAKNVIDNRTKKTPSETDDDDNDDDNNDKNQQGSANGLSSIRKKEKELQAEVDEIEDDYANLENSKQGVLDTEAERKERERIAANVAKIQKQFRDLKNKEDILNATKQVKQKERAASRAIDAERRHGDPLQKFKLNLNRFIKDQISEIEDDTYTRTNPSYEDSDFLVPGRHILDNKFIPKINVYHDVSVSFSDPAKTEMAMRAIDSLNKYKRQGDIEIDVFYFADRVSSTREGAGGGTEGTPIQEHIKLTKPTNVIIITDGDISDCREVVTVPGAVWMLFYGSESKNVQEHIRGKKQNKYFDVTWSR